VALEELAQLDDVAFRRLFAGTPVKRTGRDRFVRNVMIAMGNSNNKGMMNTVLLRLDDISPLVRGMAVWALAQLDPLSALSEAHKRAQFEPDAHVQQEWAAVLADHEHHMRSAEEK
jgi:epoxyqueuosine reductase